MEINGKADGDIIARINDKYPKMSKSHKAIAAYINNCYEQAVFMTAAKLGETVGVSESTVVRFASGIGYAGYPEFQAALEEWVKDKLNAVQKIGVKYGRSTQSEVLTSVLQADIEKIQDTIEHLDGTSFEMAVDIILNAETVYVVGIRSCEPLAGFFQFYLNMIRGNVVLLRTTSISEMFEQMIRINERDAMVGISFPRYSMRTLKAMEFANDRNAKVIAITDNVHSPMNLYSSCNLFARSDMVSIVDSLVAPLSLLNALVVALCLKRPAEVKQNMEELERVWSNYQVYLNDEINYIEDEPMLDYSLSGAFAGKTSGMSVSAGRTAEEGAAGRGPAMNMAAKFPAAEDLAAKDVSGEEAPAVHISAINSLQRNVFKVNSFEVNPAVLPSSAGEGNEVGRK